MYVSQNMKFSPGVHQFLLIFGLFKINALKISNVEQFSVPFGCTSTFETISFSLETPLGLKVPNMSISVDIIWYKTKYTFLKFNKNLLQILTLFTLKICQFWVDICFAPDFEHYHRYGLHQNTKSYHLAMLVKNWKISCFNIVHAPIRHKNEYIIFCQNFDERQGKIFCLCIIKILNLLPAFLRGCLKL